MFDPPLIAGSMNWSWKVEVAEDFTCEGCYEEKKS